MSAKAGEDGAGETADLRRALVRFLVESSFEGTQQARVADELLKSVRSVPGQSGDLSVRLERIESAVTRLAGQVEQLSAATKGARGTDDSSQKLQRIAAEALTDVRKAVGQVESLAAAARGQPLRSPPAAASAGRRMGFVGSLLGSLIAGVAAATLTAALLLNRALPAAPAHPDTPAAVAETAAPQAAPPPAAGAPPAPSPAATAPAPTPAVAGTPAAAPPPGAAWQGLWGRALTQPVTACPVAGGAGASLRRCVCATLSDEQCTLERAQSQGTPTTAVMLLQAVLRAHNPPLIQGPKGEVDGQLGNSTLAALVKLTHGCPKLSRAAAKLATDWKAGRSSVDARAALDPILTGLENESPCPEGHADDPP